ncbi:unnamed protein product [Durusdinium trenchii]|uniref:PPIase cyclophilin-type domain-containing protein n=1 Tax=Durusdinium trenchii TaxID=1381693 RepID=A0ABP0IEM2_9DINO
MTQSAMQLTITIPEGAAPGSILSIPVKGRPENVKAVVPEGYGPGDELVLMQLAGTDKWVKESVLNQAEQDAANAVFGDVMSPEALVPPGISFPEEADLGPLMPSSPVAHTVRLDTTIGIIDIIVRPDWAPYGARRFLQLAYCGDLDGLAFYRAVRGCLSQFGLPAKRQWPPLPDDPKTGVPFLLGAVCFAAAGENSRKSTLFICTGDMSHCFGGEAWETPIGAVAEVSLDTLERIETCYGDIAECNGSGPDTSRIHAEGDAYLAENFPKLTYIRTAKCLDWPLARGACPEVRSDLPPGQMEQMQSGPVWGSDQTAEVRGAPRAVSSGVTINTTPCAAQMAQSQQAHIMPSPMVPGMSYKLPADRSFELQAQQQAQMLMAAAAAQPAEAPPVTTSSSVQLVPAGPFPNGSYVPPRSGSYVPPISSISMTQPPVTLSMPAIGPPLGQPGLCSQSVMGPCGCTTMPPVRPRSSSLQAPPGPPGPQPLGSPSPLGFSLGPGPQLGSPSPLGPLGSNAGGPNFAARDPMPFNFQGLQMPQLQMPTLGSLLPGPAIPTGGRPNIVPGMFGLGSPA